MVAVVVSKPLKGWQPCAALTNRMCNPNFLIQNQRIFAVDKAEIYYKDGWNVYVDGEQKTYFSGDWVLRAMRIPAGTHKIEFKFEPAKYYTGEKVSLVSCILLFGMLGGAIVLGLRKKRD